MHTPTPAAFALSIAVLGMGVASARCDIVSFTHEIDGYASGVDTQLRSDHPDTSYETAIRLYGGSGGETRIHGLLRFDGIVGEGPGQIPPGSTIDRAELLLLPGHWWEPPETAMLYEMTVGWTGASTWNSMDDGITIGVETRPDVIATFLVLDYHRMWFDVTASVARWVEEPASNSGWLFWSEPRTSSFAAHDNDNTTDRPTLVVFFTPPDPCPADIDGNGMVEFADLLLVLAAWGPCEGECPEDLDQDGEIGFGDVLILLAAWGAC